MTRKRENILSAVTVVILSLCAVSSCALPQWRVFQKKIDPKVAEKPAAQIEAERRAAAYLRDVSAAPAPDTVAQVAQIHSVAMPLASSLGEPKSPVTPADQAAIIAELRAGKLAEQKKAEQWKAFAQKYAGQPLEDTGINLAGPAGLLALAGVVAACIACPAFGYMLLRMLPLLWGYFRRTTSAVSEFAAAHPAAGEQLKATLSRKMDTAHKTLVQRHKVSAAVVS